ncbi:MAG: hypothetical protein NDJ89_18100 [Oligoflexia bacterium]|nr:hypothetical protein [Oligoflexia bacterium]
MRINVNGRALKEVVIDDHYESKHRESITDEVILKLLGLLDDEVYDPEGIADTGFEYYRTEPLFLDGKPYRLVWLLHPEESYLGVVNCFRRRYGKSRKSQMAK